MKKFFLKSGFLALLVILTCVGLFLLPLPYNHELAAIINKRDMLKQGDGGRIIFVGGSGLYDGLDSAGIREKLNRPVVNLGLYAGFGISSVIREIRPYIRENDTVVLIPEYGVILDSYQDETRKWLFALSPRCSFSTLYDMTPKGAGLFLEDFFTLLRTKVIAAPKFLRRSMRSRGGKGAPNKGYVLYAERFNEYGDSLVPFKKVSPEKLEGRGVRIGHDFANQDFGSLNEFSRFVATRGAGTFFVFPAYPREEYLMNRQEILQYERNLRLKLLFPVLGKPAEFTYSYGLFTNTVNHLTEEGKEERTRKVIALLKRQVPPQAASGISIRR